MTRFDFGRLGPGPVGGYRLDSGAGVSVAIVEYGATVISITAPDRWGRLGEITLGCDSLEEYQAATHYYGAVVGRSAGRIAGARFMLDGSLSRLAANAGTDHLHGGLRGFDRCLWIAEPDRSDEAATVVLRLASPDGDEGYPGRVDTSVRYRLGADNALTIEFEAVTDRPTPVNLTQHAYFNLSGDPSRTILDHQLTVAADRYIPATETLLPAGGPAAVDGTPFDFRTGTAIGARIHDRHPQLALAGGYDHSYVLWLDRSAGRRHVARLTDPSSGRVLDVATTTPCLHLYTGNFLAGAPGRNGTNYPKHAGLALESQHFADSPNRPEFPSTILRPGERYRTETTWTFLVDR